MTLLLQAFQAEDLAGLAGRLSDEDVEVREAAGRALEGAGERAVPFLLSAAEAVSPESRFRALRILGRLEAAPKAVDLGVGVQVEGRKGTDCVYAFVTLVNRGRAPLLIARARLTLRGLELTQRPPEGFEYLSPDGSCRLSFEGRRADLNRTYVLCRGMRPAEQVQGMTFILRPDFMDSEKLAELLNTHFSTFDVGTAPRLSAVADPRTRLLLLRGAADEVRMAREVVADLDVNWFPGADARMLSRPVRGDPVALLAQLLHPEDCADED